MFTQFAEFVWLQAFHVVLCDGPPKYPAKTICKRTWGWKRGKLLFWWRESFCGGLVSSYGNECNGSFAMPTTSPKNSPRHIHFVQALKMALHLQESSPGLLQVWYSRKIGQLPKAFMNCKQRKITDDTSNQFKQVIDESWWKDSYHKTI